MLSGARSSPKRKFLLWPQHVHRLADRSWATDGSEEVLEEALELLSAWAAVGHSPNESTVRALSLLLGSASSALPSVRPAVIARAICGLDSLGMYTMAGMGSTLVDGLVLSVRRLIAYGAPARAMGGLGPISRPSVRKVAPNRGERRRPHGGLGGQTMRDPYLEDASKPPQDPKKSSNPASTSPPLMDPTWLANLLTVVGYRCAPAHPRASEARDSTSENWSAGPIDRGSDPGSRLKLPADVVAALWSSLLSAQRGANVEDYAAALEGFLACGALRKGCGAAGGGCEEHLEALEAVLSGMLRRRVPKVSFGGDHTRVPLPQWPSEAGGAAREVRRGLTIPLPGFLMQGVQKAAQEAAGDGLDGLARIAAVMSWCGYRPRLPSLASAQGGPP